MATGVGFKAASQASELGLLEDTVTAAGVGCFSEMRHVLYAAEESELAFVGDGRVSLLTGEWERRGTSRLDRETDLLLSEAALGMEWKRTLGRGVLMLRAQYEAQLWDNDVTSDIVFNGGALRAGFHW